MQNQAPFKYEFRGFRLIKANVERINIKPLNAFSIQARKKTYDEKNKIYELAIDINLQFAEDKSSFVFSAGYMINDLEWLEVMSEQFVVNELFAVVLPFLREKIFEFTSDFRPGFMIPTFDLKNFDFTKNITFNLEIKQVKPNEGDDSNLVN